MEPFEDCMRREDIEIWEVQVQSRRPQKYRGLRSIVVLRVKEKVVRS